MGKSDFIKRIEDELILAAKSSVISSYTAETLEDLCKTWDSHNLDIMISTESPDKIIKLFTDLCNGKTLIPVDFEQDKVENVYANFNTITIKIYRIFGHKSITFYIDFFYIFVSDNSSFRKIYFIGTINTIIIFTILILVLINLKLLWNFMKFLY